MHLLQRNWMASVSAPLILMALTTARFLKMASTKAHFLKIGINDCSLDMDNINNGSLLNLVGIDDGSLLD
jgi:hypothetical protein